MKQKKSNFLCNLFLILFFSIQYSNVYTINFSGAPLTEGINADDKVVDMDESTLLDSLHVSTELLFELSMLPPKGQSITVLFDSSTVPNDEKPRIIFEPTFFGNAGRVSLLPLSRFVFSGDGIIEVRNGVTFDLSSSQLVLEKGATLQASPGATVTFVNQKPVEESPVQDKKTDDHNIIDQEINDDILGQEINVPGAPGQLILRKGGQILLNNPSHLIFGANPVDTIIVQAEFGGQFIVDNKDALVSFHRGTFDILFNNFSILRIMDGTVELNSYKGTASPGIIRKWHFQTGAMLEVSNNSHGLGALSFAPNSLVRQHTETDFDNRTSFTSGTGNLQFKSFNDEDDVTVDSTVQIQPHLFEQKGSILDLFITLASINVPGNKSAAHVVKLVQQGSKNGSDYTAGQLAAFGPASNGSVDLLLPGDHKMFYDSNEPGGPLNVIRGYDMHNKLFIISNGKRYS